MRLKNRITLNKRLIIKLVVLSLYAAWLVTYFLWGIDYIYLGLTEKPTRENEQLALQIESSREDLANMPDSLAERQQQLVQAQELLATEQGRVPAALNINDLVRDIIEIADDCQIKAIPLRTTPPDSKIIGQYSYTYWHIFMSLEGNFQDMADFVEKIDGKDISTATITSITLNRTQDNPEGSTAQDYAAMVSGSLEVIVYSVP